MASPITSLPRPPKSRVYSAPSASRWQRTSLVGATPERLASVLRQAERGELEAWADTAEYMLRTDPHARSVYETYIRSLVATELVWDPADDSEGAALAASLMADAWDKVDDPERSLEHLAHGEGVFAGVVEMDWHPVRTEHGVAWLPTKHRGVAPRDVKFDADWTPLVRSWAGNRAEWHRVDDSPASWLVHVPGGIGLPPQLAGVLMACAWSWLFKMWAGNYRQTALERFANPIALGTHPASAGDGAPEALLYELENLSAVGALVVDEGVRVELLAAARSGAEDWQGAIRHFEDEITKAILGSTLNVDVGSTGGNRALGESQANTTILPRLQASASKLGSTLRRGFAKPVLALNAQLFGGRMLPVPIPRFVLGSEEKPTITRDHIDAGVITRNELRASAGLDEIPADEGGDEWVVPVAKQAPAFERRTGEVGTTTAPFSRTLPRGSQTSLPLMTRRTSPTSSVSQRQIDNVPWPASEGPAKLS